MGRPTYEMDDIFHSRKVENETVMFLDAGEKRRLLFRADRILSVTSYDGSKEYVREKDFVLEDGMIKVPEGSSIPLITSEKFFNHPERMLIEIHDGKEYQTYWGEGAVITDYQVRVSYEHSDRWDGFYPENRRERFEKVLAKMEKGENVTFLFYGDSITYGASSSFAYNYPPFTYSYPLLFTCELAKKYGYEVKYLDGKIPAESDVYGDKGVIYYINPSVGGWTSGKGVENFEVKCTPFLKQYGCDLAVIAFGMNDRQEPGERLTVGNLSKITDMVRSLSPDVSVLFISTMMPNPDSLGWMAGQELQEAEIAEMTDGYSKSGLSCALLRMTSFSQEILKRKMFRDYTGNNINHPNDFFSRVYAQAVFQTVYGY